MKKHIPNGITCCNLLCGCVAVLCAHNGFWMDAAIYILLGAIFDFFDGFAARLLKVSSPMGKELDSLADVITFGLAPAVLVMELMQWLMRECGPEQVAYSGLYALPALLIAAFSALRLAKFNIDERQTTSFIGLPTPANALFWSALALSLRQGGWLVDFPLLAENLWWMVLVGIALSCWLLVSEIPMFALKFKHFGWKGNELRYGFILLSLVLLLWLGIAGFSAIIVLYILTSLVACRRKN